MDLGNLVETVVHYILIRDCEVRLSIAMIHQATILHGLSTLREYWVCIEI